MDDPRVISYQALRKAIGIIGLLLPFVLVIGTWLLTRNFPAVRSSISSYYYSTMGDVLVGSLCAIGVFLFSYKGYDSPASRLPFVRGFVRGRDDLVSSLAGVCAVGVAIFPTQEESTSAKELVTDIPGLHVLFAAIFFVSLAYISSFRFTDHGPVTREPETRDDAKQERRWENLIYRVCGGGIVACLLLIVGAWAFQDDYPLIKQVYPVLVLETLAIWAFSISWFLKGSESLKRALRKG